MLRLFEATTTTANDDENEGTNKQKKQSVEKE